MPVSIIERPVSALRQRMLEDIAMRGLRSDTQHDYVRVVRSFAAFLGQSPDKATAEDIRRFQVHQRESGVQPPTINCSVSALRFFFTVTLDRPDLSRRLVLARYPRKLPAVLSVEEVGRLLEAAPGIKYKAILGTAYGAGLRVSEVANLKSLPLRRRMMVRVSSPGTWRDRPTLVNVFGCRQAYENRPCTNPRGCGDGLWGFRKALEWVSVPVTSSRCRDWLKAKGELERPKAAIPALRAVFLVASFGNRDPLKTLSRAELSKLLTFGDLIFAPAATASARSGAG
jgi:hypothetical protein